MAGSSVRASCPQQLPAPASYCTDPLGQRIATIDGTVGYPMLKSYALAGDFEGVLTLAFGLHDTTSIRVGELPGAGPRPPVPELADGG